MAKTTVQAAGRPAASSSSSRRASPLKGGPPLYARPRPRVTGGMDVVQKIGKLGQVETELPTKRVVIKHALLHTG